MEISRRSFLAAAFPVAAYATSHPIRIAKAPSNFERDPLQGGDGTDWYYVRVAQTNGSMAWSSPVRVRGG